MYTSLMLLVCSWLKNIKNMIGYCTWFLPDPKLWWSVIGIQLVGHRTKVNIIMSLEELR